MFEDETSDNMNADEAVEIGGQRFASASLFDAPVFVPPDPVWASSTKDLAKKQVEAYPDIEKLLCAYLELLQWAKAVVEFWQNNVGPTEDWPLSMVGESEEVEACLQRRMEKLQTVVSYIEESACS